MKKITTLLTSVFLSLMMQAQSLTPTVISSTGGFSSNANGSLSYTVGEMTMVQTFSANGNILTQGFQQPNDNITGLIDLTHDDYGSLVVYPNPAVDNLWYGFQFPENGKIQVALYDMLGQVVSELYTADYTGGKTVQQISVSSLAAADYFIKSSFTAASNGKVYTTSKRFVVIN
jgi:hypothetical protein